MMKNYRNLVQNKPLISFLIRAVPVRGSGSLNLVYYESFDDVKSAIQYETRLKKWNRKWKVRLIEQDNPAWKDLYEDLI